jgi:hypothetical protein
MSAITSARWNQIRATSRARHPLAEDIRTMLFTGVRRGSGTIKGSLLLHPPRRDCG